MYKVRIEQFDELFVLYSDLNNAENKGTSGARKRVEQVWKLPYEQGTA